MEYTTDEIMIAEVNEIFKYLEPDLYDKIPEKIIRYIKENDNGNYHFEYDTSKELIDQNISEKTRDFIGLLHFMFWCTPEKKEELKIKLIENEQKKDINQNDNSHINDIESDGNQEELDEPVIINQGNYADFVLSRLEETDKALKEEQKRLKEENAKKQENYQSSNTSEQALSVQKEGLIKKIIDKIKNFFTK